MSRSVRIVLALVLVATPACSLITDSSRFVGSDPGIDVGPIDGGGFDTPDVDASVPVLTTIGLSTYRPIIGEILSSAPGPLVGGTMPTRISRAWFVDDEVEPASTDPTFSTAGLAAGAEIRLEAWGVGGDGTEGPRVTVGPVRLLAPPAWRPLVPDAGFAAATVVFDAPHRRWIRFSRGIAWEERIEGTRLVRLPLAPEGIAPAPGGIVTAAVIDPARSRVIVLATPQNVAEIDVYTLDLTTRGAERWSLIDTDVTGEPPAARFFSPAAFDEDAERLWLFPGFVDGADPVYVWQLDFAAATPTWSSFLMPTGFEARPAAAVVMSPTEEGIAYMFGGGRFATGSLEPRTDLLRLTLDASGPTASLVPGATLPRALFGAQGVAVGDDIYVAGGATELGNTITTTSGVLRFTPGSDLAELSTSFAGAGIFGALAVDPDAPQSLLLASYAPPPDGHDSLLVSVVRLATDGTAMPLVTAEAPNPRTGASTLGDGDPNRMRIAGGWGDTLAVPTIWTLSFTTLEWSFVPIAPDPEDGVPLPRQHVRSFNVRDPVFYGGDDSDTSPVTDGPWLLADRTAPVWQRAEFIPADPPYSFDALPHAIDATIFSGGCGPNFFGGELAGGTVTDELYELRCNFDDGRECRFLPGVDSDETSPTDGRPWPSARAEAVTVPIEMPQRVVLYSGRSNRQGNPIGDVWTFDSCAAPSDVARFQEVTATGPAPVPRVSPAIASVSRMGRSEVMIFGGVSTSGSGDETFFDDVHRLVVTSATAGTWEAIDVVGARPLPRHGAVSRVQYVAGGRHRLIVIGGLGDVGSTPFGDAWELVFVP